MRSVKGLRRVLRALAGTLLVLGAPAAAQAPALASTPGEVAVFGVEDAPIPILVRGATDLVSVRPLFEAFVETFPGLRVTFESWNTNDLYRMSAEACRTGAPEADLLMSSAVDQLVKLVNDGCARPHRSLQTEALPPSAIWRDELFGVTWEPAVIVYNTDLVPPGEVPRSRFDLIDLLRPEGSRYAGRVATYDIEASGVGYLFAFVDSQQATTFGSLIEAFGRSGAVATCCSAEIIEAVATGRYLVAYNVLGSYALAQAARDPRISVVAPEDYTLVLRRGVVIPRAAQSAEAAGTLIDFMLSEPGRAALAQTHLLARTEPGQQTGLELPESSDVAFREIPLSPVLLLGLDRQKRAGFLDLWRGTFSR